MGILFPSCLQLTQVTGDSYQPQQNFFGVKGKSLKTLAKQAYSRVNPKEFLGGFWIRIMISAILTGGRSTCSAPFFGMPKECRLGNAEFWVNPSTAASLFL
ncbi:hypothetical protein [Limnothrix sp. PR1529]|uniref:hypothetical protein n=1 Tax=Limnothrix sp. PR1529 TaxID=1704291 RepID=UPI00117BC31C|nr:hypothetical protein [Limnothrix sp. PR1529]